jgi:hypothetical protein
VYVETLTASITPGIAVSIIQTAESSSLTPNERELHVLGPQYPTHMAKTGLPIALDIVVLKNIYILTAMEVLYGLSSDHLPVLLDLGDEKELLRTYTRTFTD